jgi:hypothetical protein
VDAALHGQLQLLGAGEAVLGDGLHGVRADRQGLGVAVGPAVRLDDRHVVGQEPALPLAQ